jgi:6-pyruvoyltetrahydropterin/6-carboxytetrahydropterin synthase
MTYISTKTYGHNLGFSCCFRQWRAPSHCRFFHGYALEIHFEFIAKELNEQNWVCDFGGFKSLKTWLEDTFDHKMLVAEDDPELDRIGKIKDFGMADIVMVPATGCEAFAEMIFKYTQIWLKDNGYSPRVEIHLVEVREHGANSAIYLE